MYVSRINLTIPVTIFVLPYLSHWLSQRLVFYRSFFLQVLVGAVIAFERKSGVRSSGILIIFWIVMVAYSAIKLRTLILLSMDYVRVEWWECIRVRSSFWEEREREDSLHCLHIAVYTWGYVMWSVCSLNCRGWWQISSDSPHFVLRCSSSTFSLSCPCSQSQNLLIATPVRMMWVQRPVAVFDYFLKC